MTKRLLTSVILFFFFFSLGVIAKEKEKAIIEHLVWAETPPHDLSYEFIPTDPTAQAAFKLDPCLEFHVPASPKSEMLIFEILLQSNFRWISFNRRKALIQCWFRFISDYIPNDIEVWNSPSMLWIKETNNSLDKGWARDRRTMKIIMRKNHVDWLWITYKNSGEQVPDDIALPIINDLIDNGFDMEVWVEGAVQGIDYILFCPIIFEVKSITKK